MHEESLYAERAIRAGARGYIMKKNAHNEIINAIKKVLSGEMYLSDGISLQILTKIMHHPDSADNSCMSPVDILSNRELEIYRLIGSGMSSSTIRKRLNISINTIQSHKRHIKEKLGFKDASELIQSAVLLVKEVE
jgi:DNA-binding NarL/FixJ family response regulator